MGKDTSPYVVGEYWLDKRRDGKSPDVWQIARYAPSSRSVIYRSTHKRSLEDAKGALNSFAESQWAKRKQEPSEARVIPMLMLYWQERGRKLINADQTGRSLRTFIGFLMQDEATTDAVVTDLNPALFERFREWRMGPHSFNVPWAGEDIEYASDGVSGNTVDRNLNDVRAAVNHAEANMRIPFAPRVKTVEKRYLNPERERVLTEDELARIFWYARHFPTMFRFVALQMVTSVRPDAAKKFDPTRQYDDRFGLIDLQPGAAPRTKKRNAVIPAIRPMKVVLRAWARDGYKPVDSNKTAWRNMRRVLDLSDDVFPKTIRHTIATELYNDPSVPERQVSEMLGHDLKLSRTSRIYAKYRPENMREAVAALTKIWMRTSKAARSYGADHLLTTTSKGKRIVIDRPREES